MDIERYELVKTLREQGKTFREIAEILGITHSRAQMMFSKATDLANNKHLWTAGLGSRLEKVVLRLGFQNKDQLRHAFENSAIYELTKVERGIGPAALADLARWTGFESNKIESANQAAIARAIILLEKNGYRVQKES